MEFVKKVLHTQSDKLKFMVTQLSEFCEAEV